MIYFRPAYEKNACVNCYGKVYVPIGDAFNRASLIQVSKKTLLISGFDHVSEQ